MSDRVLMVGGFPDAVAAAANYAVDLVYLQERSRLNPDEMASATELFVGDVNDATWPYWDAILSRAHQLRPFTHAVSLTEFGLEFAALFGQQQGLRATSLSAVQTTRDKFVMREHMRGLDSTVDFSPCNDPAQIAEFLDYHSPVIVKPSKGTASAQVTFATNVADVARHIEAPLDPRFGEWMMEEYVEGQEYSIESFTSHGEHRVLAITETITTGPPTFLEIGHICPAVIDPQLQEKIERIVRTFLTVIRLDFGPAHTEVRVTPTGSVKIIESQTRPGGDRISLLVKLATGNDLYDLTIRELLRLPVTIQADSRQTAAVEFLMPPQGQVTQMSGLEELKALPFIAESRINVVPGDMVRCPDSSFTRTYGHLVVFGASRDQCLERLKIAQDVLIIQ